MHSEEFYQVQTEPEQVPVLNHQGSQSPFGIREL
jgi:hypothetical protein